MIELFDFNYDNEKSEIFPPSIYDDPYVVFHGTSTYHSQSIEENGFIKGFSPFNLEDGKELVKFLVLDQVKPFDKPTFLGFNTSTFLSSYIAGIENGQFRLSCSYLSYFCGYFASGK